VGANHDHDPLLKIRHVNQTGGGGGNTKGGGSGKGGEEAWLLLTKTSVYNKQKKKLEIFVPWRGQLQNEAIRIEKAFWGGVWY